MKLLCYSAKLIAGLNATKNPDLAKRFAIVSSRISGARATLRLIDDIPMLQYTIEYGLGQKVPIATHNFNLAHCSISHCTAHELPHNVSVMIHHLCTMDINENGNLMLNLLWSCVYLYATWKEPDLALSLLGVIGNAIDHIYYPVEKISWLAEHNCLTLKDPDRWDTVGSIFWVLSIYLNLLRFVRHQHITNVQIA